ncbi:INP4B phosphatase, partial [Polypterus senegalus]
MSVTLEQCTLLRDEHNLHRDHFIRALDCMRSALLCPRGPMMLVRQPCARTELETPPPSRHSKSPQLLSFHLYVALNKSTGRAQKK